MGSISFFDILAISVIFISIIVSMMRGLVGEIFSLIGWIIALFVARLFAVPISEVFFSSMNPRPLAVICAFILIYIVTRLGIALIQQLTNALFKQTCLSSINCLLGGILGAIKGILIVSLVVLACSLSDLPRSEDWQQSISAPFFESIALMEKDYLPDFFAQQVQFNHQTNEAP